MKLEKKRYEDVVILKFVGEFDTFNLPAFQERIEKMVSGGDILFILDVYLLKFINSSALGFLIRFSKQLKEQGGEVVLARPSKFLRKTLVTLGLEGMFPIFESVEDGILHFKKSADVAQLHLEGGEHDEALTGAVPILFRKVTAGDAAPPNQVGRIVTLYDDGLLFRYQPEGEIDPVEMDLTSGAKLKLKFRQPFAVKDHYFEMEGQVSEVNTIEGTEGEGDRVITIRVVYDKIKEDDREHLDQFVRDQDMWRAELKS
ncbi:MAG: STAS domain-containing protein [Planctomycetota bacterium]|jgi:anti-anti-sigma factor